MSEARLNITKSKDILRPTYYVEALLGEFAQYAFDETKGPEYRGRWREEVFQSASTHPLDVEIGTGNGYFFAHRAKMFPERNLVGVELKFKPLIQSIRRALNQSSKNTRAVRYNASYIDKLFAPGEINNVFVHHPDPWSRRRKQKHRLMNQRFLNKLFELQSHDSFLDFKTDSAQYFFWARNEFNSSPYKITRYTENLHQSEWNTENYITHFEHIFMTKGQPIYYLRAEKKV